jgi:glutamate-1-semialdehyde 2,1-aminomutase
MMNYQDRLLRVIPGGAHTYSRGFDQFPSNAPQILARGEGAYVWDPDGRRYLDYGMGLRAVTLGYGYTSVAEAAYREILHGNNLPRASLTELEAAELIVDLIPAAEMVKFAKNGSNVTTGAAKVARAFTGRRYICIARQHPFFSFDDWFIGTTPITKGIPPEYVQSTLVFDYGDIASLERLFDQYPNQIAGVMLEPATTLTPCPQSCDRPLTYESQCHKCMHNQSNFLHSVQHVCRANGALLILDEMISGFRWHLQGAQTYFGIEPDLSTFGKGMANGFSVAALVGRREIMEVGSISKPGAERTFLLSTTHGGEMCGLRAFIETVRVYREKEVCRHLWHYGQELRAGLNQAAAECGVTAYFDLEGPDIALNYVTRDCAGAPSLEFRTLFSQEMVRHGVLMHSMAVSLSHGEPELSLTVEAARKAFAVYAKALRDGIDKYLEGPAVKPVFRKFN